MSHRDASYVPPPTMKEMGEVITEMMTLAPQARDEMMHYLGLNDFWFFMRFILSTSDFICDDEYLDHYRKPWYDHPWLFQRCRDIQEKPNNVLRLWPRYFFKSTTETFGHTLWDLADNPNQRFAIVTYKIEGMGSRFVRQIMKECETNQRLNYYYPSTFWEDPVKQSQKWTGTELVMRRVSSPKEPTISSFGLASSQAVGMHFDVLIYDDIVEREAVNTKEMKDKITRAWRESAALGGDTFRARYVGTRWAMDDTYHHIIKSGAVDVDHQLPYDELGNPVFRSREWIEMQRGIMQNYVFSSQILNSPVADGQQVFDLEQIQWYDEDPDDIAKKCNVYILGDFARSTKKDSDPDYTVLAVVAVGQGNHRAHYYLLDLLRERINLTQTTDHLFAMYSRWNKWDTFRCALVEQIGAQRDIEHFKHVMVERNQRFSIYPFFEHSGPGKIKKERIRRLQGGIARKDWSFPRRGIMKVVNGRSRDMVQVLLNEEMQYWTPEGGAQHDDMLDALSWVHSPDLRSVVVPPRRFTSDDPWTGNGRSKIHQRKRRASPWAI